MAPGPSLRPGVMAEARVHIGTSGWVYRWWRGVFYPEALPQRAWLAHYVRHFNTVEINATFYRLPNPETFARWREAAPPGFVYAVKASRQITHLKRLKDCAEALSRFLDAARELGPALGPILYQLPPSLKADPERLADFAAILPGGAIHVFEFRDASWFTEAVRAMLEEAGHAFCIHDHHGMAVPRWVTGPVAYWRFHGLSRAPDSGYGEARLRPAAAEMRRTLSQGRDVYAYFNNDAHGCAVRDAARLKTLVEACQDPPSPAAGLDAP